MEQVGIARRDFLKGIAAAALTAGVIGTGEARALAAAPPWAHSQQNILPQTLQPFPTIQAPRGTEGFWAQVRNTFILPDNYIHMNTGTTGSQPLFSLINLGVYNLYKSLDPRDWQTNLNTDYPVLFPFVKNSALTARQTAVAAQYGADASKGEIVLSYNTTDALNLIFAGTPWNKGDRIICTQWEHAALTGPIAWARDYFGVEVRIVTLPSNFNMTVEQVVAAFAAELLPYDSKTKQYIATSEVFYKNGLRMPVKELCQLAQDPKYKAFTIIDSAHAWGQLPVNCHDYGADFISGAGHKWLCGGPGTGILYVRNSGAAPLPPFNGGNWAAYGNLFTAPSARFNARVSPAGSIQNRGETNTPALFAMSDSAAYFGYIGVPDIYERGVALGNYFKAKVAAQWGPNSLFVQQNDDKRFWTALTAFNPFVGKDDSNSFTAMNNAINSVLVTLAGEDPKIYIRSITFRDSGGNHDSDGNPIYPGTDNRVALRVSTHGVYNNQAQIDYMFDRLVKAVTATGLTQAG